MQDSRPSPVATRTPMTAAPRSASRTPAQVLAAVFGLTFLLVGVAGFIPGITSNYDELDLLGTDSRAELLGLFRVSILHNLVHALFGVGLLAAARDSWAKLYLLGGGSAYLLVTVYGSVVDHESDANFLPFNNADNVLHLVLSLGLIAAGVAAVLAERRRST
jgi:hypothetical protein